MIFPKRFVQANLAPEIGIILNARDIKPQVENSLAPLPCSNTFAVLGDQTTANTGHDANPPVGHATCVDALEQTHDSVEVLNFSSPLDRVDSTQTTRSHATNSTGTSPHTGTYACCACRLSEQGYWSEPTVVISSLKQFDLHDNLCAAHISDIVDTLREQQLPSSDLASSEPITERKTQT